MTPRSTGRKDGNEKEIVNQCRKFGMLVIIQSQYRAHDFDLLIGYRDAWLPFEVKKDKREKLRPRQAEFKEKCEAKGLPIYTVTNFETVMSVFDGLDGN